MKKSWLILCTSFTLCVAASAQGLGGIFSQKSSDLKELAKQIALMQVYIMDVEKGYQVAKSGLDFIGAMKKSEFNLHSLFFSSLERVNPAVAKYAKITAIINYQLDIVSSFKAALRQYSRSKSFTASEMTYINSVYINLTDECSKSLDELIDLTTDGKLQMTDDDRIKRIDALYTDMKDKYAFTRSFTSSADLLGAERMNELTDIETLKRLE